MERRQTGGEADESAFFFLNGIERERHAEAAGWKERSEGWRGGLCRQRTLGWRGARDELADFGNPPFINVKPSSAECGRADITAPLATGPSPGRAVCLRQANLLRDWPGPTPPICRASKPPVN